MRVLILLLLVLPSPAFSQQVSEKAAESKLKALADSGSEAVRGTLSPESTPPQETKPLPPRLLSTDEVLSGLAREVQDLRARVSVSAATAQSTQRPQAAKNIGSKTYYNFGEGAIYQIHAGVDRVTDVEFQPGEKLTNQPVAGDTVRWTVGTMQSAGRLGEQVHLIIKPLEEQLETNIIVTTNRRVYHLQVTSGDWYMPAVAWHYPDDDEAARKVEIQKRKDDEPLSLPPEKLDFDYEIVNHDEAWSPIRCFDDGQKTYLQMPKQMAVGEAPALFLIEDGAEPVLVNYRVKGDFYILDRLFDRAELRVGKKEQVVIYSRRKPRTFWERVF